MVRRSRRDLDPATPTTPHRRLTASPPLRKGGRRGATNRGCAPRSVNPNVSPRQGDAPRAFGGQDGGRQAGSAGAPPVSRGDDDVHRSGLPFRPLPVGVATIAGFAEGTGYVSYAHKPYPIPGDPRSTQWRPLKTLPQRDPCDDCASNPSSSRFVSYTTLRGCPESPGGAAARSQGRQPLDRASQRIIAPSAPPQPRATPGVGAGRSGAFGNVIRSRGSRPWLRATAPIRGLKRFPDSLSDYGRAGRSPVGRRRQGADAGPQSCVAGTRTDPVGTALDRWSIATGSNR